ncbi:MAG TPA: hypothetical protein PKB14_18935 [Rubrivivax sp.]|nr:hypothetical protein [Rubrivivax sp.]
MQTMSQISRLLPCLAALAVLAGCGAEVAGSAVAAGGLAATQAQQARAQQAQVLDKLGSALDAGAARAASAAD